jgi:hypothetical protein
MEQNDIETLREKVPCAAVLEREGWMVDIKESTARAVKYRRGAGEIIIVIHAGRGWFDPLSDAKGDVFTLAGYLAGIAFPAAVEAVRSLVGYVPATPSWNRPKRTDIPLSITDRWWRRRPPAIGSRTWRYLADERAIPISVLQAAIAQGLLREGPSGSISARFRARHRLPCTLGLLNGVRSSIAPRSYPRYCALHSPSTLGPTSMSCSAEAGSVDCWLRRSCGKKALRRAISPAFISVPRRFHGSADGPRPHPAGTRLHRSYPGGGRRRGEGA